MSPLVYIKMEETEDGKEREGVVAILEDRPLHLPLVPGLPWCATLRGRRLVGDALAGDSHGAAVASFLEVAIQILERRETDCLLFEDLETHSPLWRALRELSHTRRDVAVVCVAPPQAHWWIDFPERPSDYWRLQFSSGALKHQRQVMRKLEHRVECYRTEREVPAFLEKAHEISCASWQAKRLGVRIKNDDQDRLKFTKLAALGAFRSYILEHKGRPIAFLLGLQWQGCFLDEEIGHVASYAAWAPGRILLVRMLEELIARETPRRVDFGYGDAEFKYRFGNRQTISGPLLVVRRSLLPMTIARLYQLQRHLTWKVREQMKHLSFVKRWRQYYRR